MTLCTLILWWSSGRHKDTSNTCATTRLEGNLLISCSGTIVHIGESIPVCQVLYTICSLQSLRQPHRWAVATISVLQMREPRYKIVCVTPQAMHPTWQGQQTRTILINVVLLYVWHCSTCLTWGNPFQSSEYLRKRDTPFSHLTRGN